MTEQLKITTENSVYWLQIRDGRFRVLKTEEERPNPNGIDIGWSESFHSPLHLVLGERAILGPVRTSNVLAIEGRAP